MKKSVFFLFCLLIFGCKQEVEQPTMAFSSGQIINPSSDFLSLYKYDQRIDSLPLDANSRFAAMIPSVWVVQNGTPTGKSNGVD